jgi:7,8-dihydroneopterin aldolase/epimerase/oxygenase
MFEINLDLTVDLREAAASDILATTIDYGQIVTVTQRAFCGGSRQLVEAAAFDVARALLEAFPGVVGGVSAP